MSFFAGRQQESRRPALSHNETSKSTAWTPITLPLFPEPRARQITANPQPIPPSRPAANQAVTIAQPSRVSVPVQVHLAAENSMRSQVQVELTSAAAKELRVQLSGLKGLDASRTNSESFSEPSSPDHSTLNTHAMELEEPFAIASSNGSEGVFVKYFRNGSGTPASLRQASALLEQLETSASLGRMRIEAGSQSESHDPECNSRVLEAVRVFGCFVSFARRHGLTSFFVPSPSLWNDPSTGLARLIGRRVSPPALERALQEIVAGSAGSDCISAPLSVLLLRVLRLRSSCEVLVKSSHAKSKRGRPVVADTEDDDYDPQ